MIDRWQYFMPAGDYNGIAGLFYLCPDFIIFVIRDSAWAVLQQPKANIRSFDFLTKFI